MEHHCHAFGCRVVTRPEMLMCYRHWKMVPASLQRRVLVTYRRGQCDDKNPSYAWHAAADRAIAAVALKEGRPQAAEHYEKSAVKWDERDAATKAVENPQGTLFPEDL